MERRTCPICERPFVLPSPTRTWQQRLLATVGFYPFHCQFCDHRFTTFAPAARAAQTKGNRDYVRVPTRLPVAVSWEGGQAKGVVTELSIAGCGLEGEVPAAVGALLQLQIHMADQGPPLKVNRAEIRFTQANRLGVQFRQMQVAERERLRQFVLELALFQKAT